MKVPGSTYLADVKPLLKELISRLSEKYEYASILACDSRSKMYSVSRSGTVISQDPFTTDRGFVIRVYDKKSYAEYSFCKISEELLPEIEKKVYDAASTLSGAVPDGILTSEFPLISEEELKICGSSDFEEAPEALGDEKIIEFLTELHKEGKAFDEKIIDCLASCNYQVLHKLFISGKKDMEQNYLWTCGSVVMLAPKDGNIVSSYHPVSGLCGTEVLRKLKEILPGTAKQALALIDSEPMVPGEYDCICTPEVTGMIVHEAFGHGVEMDMFVKDRALAAKSINEYVASPLITMHDSACAVNQTATYSFDDEGNLSTDTVVIDKGVLVTGINDQLSAMALNCRFSGNGRRESTKRKAYTRMSNTYFAPGTDKVEDMIASIKYGFLLEEATSGMEDPKNWGIQCMVNIAKEIKDGKLTGKIFSPVVLTGYVPDLLKSISMVSEDFELGGSGFCGKGYKEWVKVSDGGPYIKAKIRLG